MKNDSPKPKIFKFLFVFFIFYFLFFILSEASAQIILPLRVAPARQEIAIDPGGETAVNVNFYNEGDSPISGFFRVADFIVLDKEGTPRIIEDVTQASPRFSASTWISIPYDRASIAPQDKVSFQAKITVPQNARAGGRYVTVYFESAGAVPQPVGGLQEAGTGVAPRVAALIYVRVSGPILEKALISRLFAKSFQEYGPVDVETDILNRGDYHIRPRGVVTLTNAFGGLVDQVKLKEQNIFPDAARSYQNALGQKWMFGRYKIEVFASYGESGQALNRALYVWVLPWRVTLVVLLALIILILLGRNIYQKLVVKEAKLEEELKHEKEEIEKLKERIKKRGE